MLGTVAVTAIEWNNPDTLGPFGVGGKLLAGMFQGLSPRTAGFNSVDTGALEPATRLVTDVLMFITGDLPADRPADPGGADVHRPRRADHPGLRARLA